MTARVEMVRVAGATMRVVRDEHGTTGTLLDEHDDERCDDCGRSLPLEPRDRWICDHGAICSVCVEPLLVARDVRAKTLDAARVVM